MCANDPSLGSLAERFAHYCSGSHQLPGPRGSIGEWGSTGRRPSDQLTCTLSRTPPPSLRQPFSETIPSLVKPRASAPPPSWLPPPPTPRPQPAPPLFAESSWLPSRPSFFLRWIVIARWRPRPCLHQHRFLCPLSVQGRVSSFVAFALTCCVRSHCRNRLPPPPSGKGPRTCSAAPAWKVAEALCLLLPPEGKHCGFHPRHL